MHTKSRRIRSIPNAAGFLCGNVTIPLFCSFLPAHGHKQEEDREDTGSEEADEAARPAEVVNDETHVDARERGADDVAHEARKAGRAARCDTRHHVRRLQSDHHDRPVDEEANGNQREVVHEDVAGRVEPVDKDRDDDERHKDHRCGRTPSAEYAVTEVAAHEHARDARPLIEEVCPARALFGETLDRREIRRRPIDDAVTDKIDEDIRDRQIPEQLVLENVLHQNFLCRHLLFHDGTVLLRVVVLVLLDRRQTAGLRRVTQEEEGDEGEDDGDQRREEEDTVPCAKECNACRRQRCDQPAAEVVRDVPPRPPRAALGLGEPRHHRLCIRRVAHPLEPSVHEAQGAHDRNARHHPRHNAERERHERTEQEAQRGKILRIRAVRDVAHDELAHAVCNRKHGQDDAKIRLGVAVVLNHVGHRETEVLANQIEGRVPDERPEKDLPSE